jgi:hypothetical protein
MTFVELLAVSAILLMLAGGMAALAINVQDSGRHNFQQAMSLQHGLVVLQRIQRTVGSATVNPEFPGFLAFAEVVAGNSYPDALVVWHAPGGAADPAGLPRMNELVVFCPNPDLPNELWEIRSPGDTRVAPAPADTSAWAAELDDLKSSQQANRIVLTRLLRSAQVVGAGGGAAVRRGVVRFETTLRPSQAEWSQFLAGTLAWNSLPWAQGIHGTQTGLRQAWCRFEFQLFPADTNDHNQEAAIPFFGSAAVMYELPHP